VWVWLGRDAGVGRSMFRNWVDVEGPTHRAQAGTPGVLHTCADVNSDWWCEGEGIFIGYEGGGCVWSVLVTNTVLTAHTR